MLLALFLAPLPIFRSIIDADEAVDDPLRRQARIFGRRAATVDPDRVDAAGHRARHVSGPVTGAKVMTR